MKNSTHKQQPEKDSTMSDLSETQLSMLCTALGWQGGTFHQVLERVKELSGYELIAKRALEELALTCRDAERYRWLRKEALYTPVGVYMWRGESGKQVRSLLASTELDDEIDAEMGV